MLNLGRNDRWVDLKDPSKPGAKPGAPNTVTQSAPASATVPAARPVATPAPEPAPPPRDVSPQPSPEEVAGSKLFVGVNIKLKGVEISNCDVLVIEGQVDATINSKVMEISKPGTLTGTAMIDVAEIHGEFSGELTARTKLVVHGTGRVTGTIRYGRLVVAEGGMLNGELKQIEAAAPATRSASTAMTAPTTTESRAAGSAPAESRSLSSAAAESRSTSAGSSESHSSSEPAESRSTSGGSSESRAPAHGPSGSPRSSPGQPAR